MAWQDGAIYWICPVDHYDVALSVRGDSQVSQNRDVFLYTKEDIADQLWKIDLYNGFARIKSTLNEAYALNIYLSTGNCDIHTWEDNLEDSKINFRTIDGDRNIYRLQNYRNDNENNNLYLTASSTASGASVTWQGLNEANSKQIWRLLKKSDGDPGGGETGGGETDNSACITLPSNRPYCWNQFDCSIKAICGTLGCSLTCVLDIANIFGPRAFSASEISQACGWNSGGLGQWSLPQDCSGVLNPDGGYLGTQERGNVLAVAKQQIDADNPIVLKLTRAANSSDTHFVVAYKYINGGVNMSDFYVLDPATGTECTLPEAMSTSNKDYLYNYILSQR